MSELADDFVEHLPCGYVRMTPRGHITRLNEPFARLTGRARAELHGKRLSELFTVGCRIYYETHFAPLLAMQGSVDQIAMDLMHASGRTVPVLVNATRCTDARGDMHIDAAVVDVTDRKTYERELLIAREKAERAAQARSEFVSTFSHEVRNPLSAIVGTARLLAAKSSDPAQQRLVAILKRSSDNLLALVNEILDYAKIDAGKITLEQRRLDIREVVYGVAQSIEAKAAEKQVAVSVSIDERLPREVVGDPVKLAQILSNLVGNAAKFTAAGAIEIRVELLDGGDDVRLHMRFSVRDTGIGIPPDRLQVIFEDYAQGGYEIGARYGGTGLGLAIVKRLVELHRSKIEVTSTLGKGSTFWFDVAYRVAAPGETFAGDEADGAMGATLRDLRALVVDDSEVNLEVMRDLLEKWSVIVDVTTSGHEAVAMSREKPYDVVLMDIHMPHLDGSSAARAIRALGGARSNVPIIAISGSMRMGAKEWFAAAGFTDFVGKPIRPDVLAATIQRHTGR